MAKQETDAQLYLPNNYTDWTRVRGGCEADESSRSLVVARKSDEGALRVLSSERKKRDYYVSDGDICCMKKISDIRSMVPPLSEKKHCTGAKRSPTQGRQTLRSNGWMGPEREKRERGNKKSLSGFLDVGKKTQRHGWKFDDQEMIVSGIPDLSCHVVPACCYLAPFLSRYLLFFSLHGCVLLQR